MEQAVTHDNKMEPGNKGRKLLSLGIRQRGINRSLLTEGVTRPQVININQNIYLGEQKDKSTGKSYQRTSKVIKESREEIHSKFDRIMSFFVQNIAMNIFRVCYYFWYLLFRIIAFPLQAVVQVGRACCRGRTAARTDQDLDKNKKRFCCPKRKFSDDSCVEQQQREQARLLKLSQQLHLMQTAGDPSIEGFSEGKRLQVVLDLDNTLIHSLKKEPVQGDPQCFAIKDTITLNQAQEVTAAPTNLIYVYKRPHLDYFISELHKFADIHIFTASSRDYADQILSVLDPTGTLFKTKFYREHCDKDRVNNVIYKDLKRIQGDDLSNLIMIDDSQINYERNQLNTFRIQYWTRNQRDDNCLRACLTLIQQLSLVENVQHELQALQNVNRTWMPFHY